MLIKNADIQGTAARCVRIGNGTITELGPLAERPDERVIDAAGGALLPGLNDHHLHLMSLAAAAESVPCGPPQVSSADALAERLQTARGTRGAGWLRGVGYHESVAGDIDRAWLDQHAGQGPVRIQHRSGRLWIVNSTALAHIAAAQGVLPPTQRPTLADDGRLYDLDPALHLLADATPPDVGKVSHTLAGFGITGITDMTPTNDARSARTLAAMHSDGRLVQHVRLAGTSSLGRCADLLTQTPHHTSPGMTLGATKVHLHEAHLPEFDDLCSVITASHQQHREVAVHCVTEVELVFTLAAFRAAGARQGDRLEHASVTPLALLEQIRELNLLVCTQPNFVSERGDAYLADIDPAEHAWLYRARSFLDHGIALAGGTDAPFGDGDPWRAMTAAVQRRTPSGKSLGADETLTPEQALDLFLGELDDPGLPRQIAPGARADLCLLDRPWREARHNLVSRQVRATLRAGELVFDRVD